MIRLALLLALLPGVARSIDLNFPAAASVTARRDEALGSYDLPIGPYQPDKGQVKSLKVEGPVTRMSWRLDATTLTTLQILTALRTQLLKQGFVVLYQCDTQDCGGFDFRYDIALLPEPEMHVDLGDFRYLAAERPGTKRLQYVSLVVSRSSRTGFVQLTQVGSDPSAPAPPAGSAAPSPAMADSGAGAAAAPTAVEPNAAFDAQDFGRQILAEGAVILSDLRFDSGSADLAPGDYASLAALAHWLKANPTEVVTLVGHTDASGSLATNIALSKRRATSVLDRLVSQYGVDRGQLDAEGVGYLAPVATNQTEAGRQENRRVEVMLSATR